ncbi:hypothetical protein AX15_003600 [Amanita polypyramis BW_CC]|nr:hypothetical protein AX15_003600 [Amanita polypyramis BW_CC]
MRWTTPPDRRELTLILFSLTVYLISYNLDSSLSLLGLNPGATQGAVLSRLGLSDTKHIGEDGRKPDGWRDTWEEETYGKWEWDGNHVAGDGSERSQPKGTGRHGAMWMSKNDLGPTTSKVLGETTVGQALAWWLDDVPLTKLVKHAPGYTVIDNAIIFNGTTYIVTNDTSSFPDATSIVATQSMDYNEWKIVTVDDARAILGKYGGVIRDVTWMSADRTPHNSTLFTLWRTYSSLDPSIDALGKTKLPAPVRLVFPNARFFTDANPPFANHWVRRRRVDTGFHPYLAKAAFPRLTSLYYEDWEDYHKMQVPFLIERLVVADRTAAQRSLHPNQPILSSSINLEGSPYWWEPMRRTLTSYYDLHEGSPPGKPVVTYLHRQGETNGPRLHDEDNELLVRSLRNMARVNGYELHVVSTLTSETRWDARMSAIVRSTVVLSPYGDHLFDGMFMKRSSKSTLIELFPGDAFVRDRELAARSIGLQYIAMCRDRKFTSESLPPVTLPNNNQVVRIDSEAIVRAIQAALPGR